MLRKIGSNFFWHFTKFLFRPNPRRQRIGILNRYWQPVDLFPRAPGDQLLLGLSLSAVYGQQVLHPSEGLFSEVGTRCFRRKRLTQGL